MDIGRNLALTIIAVCLTVLGVVYFLVIRQDSTVLLSLSSVIGGIAGYLVGKYRSAR